MEQNHLAEFMPKNPIMIAAWIGSGLDFMKTFAKWHNENIWGEDNGETN